ncbi:MAG: hypothetical protein GY856_47685 [bacterium]|nr:hypothetical protein [bacterium]
MARSISTTPITLPGAGTPFNPEDVLHRRTVESHRVELKSTWGRKIATNVVRTICAFANDLLHLNGGFVILGVEEKEGRPVLPPRGLAEFDLEKVQKEVFGVCKRIRPEYQPLCYPVEVEGRPILFLWAPGGENRPYQAPRDAYTKGSPMRHYVRKGPQTIEAKDEVLRQLLELSANVPFDDRRNFDAHVENISPMLVRGFLREIGSQLVDQVDNLDLYRKLRLVKRINEHAAPRNIALLFFNEQPHEFFARTWIEVAHFPEGASGDVITERIFRGPLHYQIKLVLDYLEGLGGTLIRKVRGKAKAEHSVAYPFEAVEEVIVNGAHHQGYDGPPEPLKVYIYPDRMVVTSYPGPMPGLRLKHFRPDAAVPPVTGRNRRVGDLLKDLGLVEAKGTGIPKIQNAMRMNGSPPAQFDFDEETRTYFSAILPIHPDHLDRLNGLSLPAAQTPSRAKPRVSLSKLPATGALFVGRDDELVRLDAAWDDPAVSVISFVAMGGVGKSALINHWLDRLADDGWRGAERVFGWSFYSQGTDGTGASGDAFVDEALREFGYEGDPITSPWEKGRTLARLVRAAPTLLVLDGLEPLQHPPGAQTGRINDPAVQALVRELRTKSAGLCVITTRLAVADIAGRAGAVEVDIEKLPSSAGAALLDRLGIEGKTTELEAAAAEFGGHALALTLLGTYLRDVCNGDVRRRHEVPFLDEEIEQGGHARRVMNSYEVWLGEGPELRVLRLLGLFDRPAETGALAALRAEPVIAGLTDEIDAGDESRWRKTVARLVKVRLVADNSEAAVDTHPLVREYFGERLREEAPEAWRAGHERLYEYYRGAATELPETVEAMMPLYAAVVHACRAGRMQEALDEVYDCRILRGAEHFSWRKLGAFGAELTALAAFFDRPWDQPSARLTAAAQARILNATGFVLRALGRLPEAVQPMRAALEAGIAQEKWKDAAIRAGDLSELTLTLGEVAPAVAAGEQSVELADRSKDAFERMVNRTTLADALHQASRWEESTAAFGEAEAMQAAMEPQYPRLCSIRGYWYCDLLLGRTEPEDGSGLDGVAVGTRYREACEEVSDRANYDIEIARSNNWLLDIALDHLSLGCAHLGLALTSPTADFTVATKHLDRAVDGLRQSGSEHHIPRGLLARAALHRLCGDAPAAAADLAEAEEIAERGHMRLYEADAHLGWTRLHLRTGDGDAARHLGRARELVTSTGYGRREREVRWLEGRVAGSQASRGRRET